MWPNAITKSNAPTINRTKRNVFADIGPTLCGTACPGRIADAGTVLPPFNKDAIVEPSFPIACVNADAELHFGLLAPPDGFAVPPPLPPPCGAPADAFPLPPECGG